MLKASVGNFPSQREGNLGKTFAATRDFYLDDEFRHSRPIYLAATSINDYYSADTRKIQNNIYLPREKHQ